jgi:hypothetical protein
VTIIKNRAFILAKEKKNQFGSLKRTKKKALRVKLLAFGLKRRMVRESLAKEKRERRKKQRLRRAQNRGLRALKALWRLKERKRGNRFEHNLGSFGEKELT